MKQYPSRLPFKKYHKVNSSFLTLVDKKRILPQSFEYAIQSVEAGKITFKHIEACRRTIRRGLGKKSDILIRLFTGTPVFKKSSGARMGKGKGNFFGWIAPIKKGQVLFEVNCKSLVKVVYTLNKACSKLPVKTQIIKLRY